MEIRVQPATHKDSNEIITLMRAYYTIDKLSFNVDVARSALDKLLDNQDYGRVWLIMQDEMIIGYIVATFGYSLEFGGRDAFIDEFYIQAAHRGKGIGTVALHMITTELKKSKFRAVHLEVERENSNAQGFYRSQGFVLRERFSIMSKYL
jgi:ribosomal protein S18 acetylase RimI-like enzyme